MTNCKFFFSYARNDKSPYLEDFINRLREEVMRKTAVKLPHEACFLDTDNIDIGSRWTTELVYALQTSHVLVCAYSPSYFHSEYCGKELSFFQSRIAASKKPEIISPDVILPVLWETPRTFSIPSSLSEIKYSPKSFNDEYNDTGLLTFSKLSKYHDAYLEFIEQLALKIQDLSQKTNLSSIELNDIKNIPNAFEVRPLTKDESKSIDLNPNPKQTRIIFAAADKNEINEIKASIENYGEKSEYWKPFYPETDDEIGIISQQVVSEKKFHYLPIQFSENLPDVIREAEDNNCVALLIVDPWSIKLEKYKKPIKKFDKEHFINSAVIVIWNSNDDETKKNKETLFSNLHNSLLRCMVDNTIKTSGDTDNIEDLKKVLSIAIDEARAKLLKRGKPFQTIKADTAPIPVLSATGGNNE